VDDRRLLIRTFVGREAVELFDMVSTEDRRWEYRLADPFRQDEQVSLFRRLLRRCVDEREDVDVDEEDMVVWLGIES